MGILDNFKAATTPEEEEAQRLKDESGVITPLGGAIVGQTPDQVKMQGTKAQKKSVLDLAAEQATRLGDVSQEQTLQGALGYRVSQEVKIPRELEQAKEMSARLKDFGSLGKRVENKVRESMLSGAEISTPIELNENQISEISAEGDDVTDVIMAFNDAIKKGDNKTAMKLLADNQKRFKDTTGIFDILEKAYPDKEAQKGMISQAIASNVIDANDLTLSKVLDVVESPENLDEATPIESLGGMTVGELVEFAGPEWYKLKVSELGDVLEGRKREILNNVSEIQRQLRNPNLSPTIRQALMEELGKYAATGVVQAEMDAQRSINQVNESGNITFGGKSFKVEELLDNDNVVAMVEKFLTADDEEKKKMKSDPDFEEFYGWVESQVGSLAEETGDVVGAINEMESIQKDNQEMIASNVSGLGFKTSLSEDTMKALGFDPDSWSTSRVDITKTPVIKSMIALSKDKRYKDADFVARINGLSKEWKEELGKMKDPTEALKFLAGDNFDSYKAISNNLDKGFNSTNSNDVIKNIFGADFGTTDTIKANMNDLRLNEFLGDKKAAAQLRILEKYFGKGGKLLDNLTELKKTLNGVIGSGRNLSDLMKSASGMSSLAKDRTTAYADSSTPTGVAGDFARHMASGKPLNTLISSMKKKDPKTYGKEIAELYKVAKKSGISSAKDGVAKHYTEYLVFAKLGVTDVSKKLEGTFEDKAKSIEDRIKKIKEIRRKNSNDTLLASNLNKLIDKLIQLKSANREARLNAELKAKLDAERKAAKLAELKAAFDRITRNREDDGHKVESDRPWYRKSRND